MRGLVAWVHSKALYRVFGQGLQDHLESLEINPLLLYGSGIEALDVLMTWRSPES